MIYVWISMLVIICLTAFFLSPWASVFVGMLSLWIASKASD